MLNTEKSRVFSFYVTYLYKVCRMSLMHNINFGINLNGTTGDTWMSGGKTKNI